MASSKAFLTEAVQFAPVITLASSFIVSGSVNVERAGTLFIITGIAAAIITAVLITKRILLNPILIGTNLWLFLGAVAFGVPFTPLARMMAEVQAGGLFSCTLGVGIVFSMIMDTGYIGMNHKNEALVQKLSAIMVGLTFFALVWSFMFINNIRVGGGLPFILLNVTRRVLIRRSRAS